jgi:hypothetical protein
MGASSSNTSRRDIDTSASVSGDSTQKTPSPSFRVTPARDLCILRLPYLTLRLDEETLSLMDPSDAVVISWPYHRILCWGYTTTVFQWRVCASAEALDAVSASAAAEQTAAEFAGGVEAKGAPSAAASQSVTFQVHTTVGRQIEAALMASVQKLMDHMTARGVGGDEFRDILSALTALSEEGLTEHALTVLRQMTLGRAFDSRQAVVLLDTLGAISPFDRVEAACTLYPAALLHPSAFPTLLQDAFTDAQDIENVLHRLGITVGFDGSVANAPTATSRAFAKK